MAQGEIFKGLPKWAQGVIAVGLLGGAAYVLYKIYSKTKDITGKKDVKTVENENLSEFNKLTKQGQKLSKPIPAYQQLINDIVTRLNGCETNATELEVVAAIIRVVKKPIDWYYLVAKFGNKDIEDCGSFGLSKTNYDLPTLLKDQLDTNVNGYAFKVDGFQGKGFVDTIDLLRQYFSKIGVVI